MAPSEPTSRMQRDVLNHLRSGRTLTQDQAKQMYGIGRLSSQISRLRKRGWVQIETRSITVRNRMGEDVVIGEYFIPREHLEAMRQTVFRGHGGTVVWDEADAYEPGVGVPINPRLRSGTFVGRLPFPGPAQESE